MKRSTLPSCGLPAPANQPAAQNVEAAAKSKPWAPPRHTSPNEQVVKGPNRHPASLAGSLVHLQGLVQLPHSLVPLVHEVVQVLKGVCVGGGEGGGGGCVEKGGNMCCKCTHGSKQHVKDKQRAVLSTPQQHYWGQHGQPREYQPPVVYESHLVLKYGHHLGKGVGEDGPQVRLYKGQLLLIQPSLALFPGLVQRTAIKIQ